MSDTRTATAQQTAVQGAPSRELKLQFHGTGREYFRIWIVNLSLTLLTFGVFSAWAKVRKKRYFYSHTAIDGTPFQYLGQPIPILKGRIVAAIVFFIYYLCSHFFIPALPYIALVGLALAPWVIVRSAGFNARYSAYRNMTFSFEATYVDAAKTIYAWGLIPALVLGAMFQWRGSLLAAGVLFGIMGLTFPWWVRRLKHFIVSHTSYGGERGEFRATTGQFYKVYLKAGLFTTLIMIVIMVPIGFVIKLLFSANAHSPLLFLLPLLGVYLGYAGSFAYVQAHIANTIWDGSRLGPLRFQSNMRARDLLRLYFTNLIGILVSLGLLIPWAVMRTLKYRTDRMRVIADGELDDFRGGDVSAVRAAGAELGEFFELDLSL